MTKKHKEVTNYYVDNMDKALIDHDINFPFAIKIRGSQNSSHWMTLPENLYIQIKNYYVLNGHNIGE